MTTLIRAEQLRREFPSSDKRRVVTAVDGVDLTVHEKEVVGLVGESGSGKSTVGRVLLKLIEPTAGRIHYRGEELTHLSREQMRPHRRALQMVFQDPYASLNRRMTIRAILEEPLRVHDVPRDTWDSRIEWLLDTVGLPKSAQESYPHAFSGGQRQRIGIARALAVDPEFLVADEPVSALDVSVQAQVLNLLSDLKRDLGLAMLFIAHDLAVVRHIADRVMVMYLGQIVEEGPVDQLFANPVHPYTEALLSAVPIPDPSAQRDRIVLSGDVPSPLDVPSGCVFRTRCPVAEPQCAEARPPLSEFSSGHRKACWVR